MSEHEAMSAYKRRVKSPVMHGAYRKGYRARQRLAKLSENPYRAHRGGTGWGRRAWEAWVAGWNAADVEYQVLLSRIESALGG